MHFAKTATDKRTALHAEYALKAQFFSFGVILTSWSSRVPDIVELLQFTTVTFSAVLFLKGVAQVLFYPAAVWMNRSFGPAKAALVSGSVVFGSLPFYTLMPSWAGLAVLFVLSGGFFSTYDIANNAMGTGIEETAKKQIMSALHAWFSIGAFTGALAGSELLSLKTPVLWHFTGASVLTLALLIISYPFFPSTGNQPTATEKSRPFAISQVIISLGLVVFFAAIIESSVGNWAPLFYRDALGTTGSGTNQGFVWYTGAILAGRLLGDKVRARIGDIPTLFCGMALSATGFLTALLAPEQTAATFGFALAGTGISIVFPTIFSLAAKSGSGNIAPVATFSYAGGLTAPLLIGFAVESFSISAAVVLFFTFALFMIPALLFYARTTEKQR
jgi:fucose permease